MIEAAIGFGAMLALVFLRVPIAIGMGLVGFAGFAAIVNSKAALAMVAALTYETGINYTLSVVPLFILMGAFVTRAGLSSELYDASYAFLGHLRGGLAMATIIACGGFSAVCGSSLATAATMAKVSMPSMRRFGYADSLATGAIAAGGTLGILIPPSVLMVIYGLMTEQDIGKLFIAGLIPGLVAIGLYLLAIMAVVRVIPSSGPPGERTPWLQRLRALRSVWGILVLFTLVMGGLYGGVFTPTEAGGIGATGAFFFLIGRRGWSLAEIYGVLLETVRTTAMLFFVLIGALIFANFINYTELPATLIRTAASFEASPVHVLLAIVAIYLILGCVLESLSMILLTVPIFAPLVSQLGIDLIWFGIIIVVATEISLITPPIGVNIFVLRSVLPEVSTMTIFRGVTPFWSVDILRIGLIVAFPALSLWLPDLMR